MHEMHKEWEKERSYQRRNDHSRPKSKWVRDLKRKGRFLSREIKEIRSDIALDLFKENASWWIEDLSRFCRALILDKWICRGAVKNLSTAKCLNGSRNYRESISQTETFSMDRESVEKLLRQNLESFDGSKMH